MNHSAWPPGLLQDWRRASAQDPVRHWGRWLMDVGVIWSFFWLTLPQPGTNIGLALILLGGILARPPINRLPGFWWAASAATLVLATTWWHTDEESGGALARNWLVAWLAAPVLVDFQRRQWALRLGMAGAAIAISLMIAQTLVGFTVDVPRWHLAEWGARFARVGGFQHPVSTANMWVGVLIWLLPPAIVVGMNQWRHWEWRGLVVMALLLTQVRMGLLALLVLLGLWWASLGRRYLLAAIIGVPLAGLALGGLLAILDPERMARMLQFEDGRWPIWRNGWAIVREHPWWGVGPGRGLSEAYQNNLQPGQISEFGTRYFNLHNSPLTIAAQHGLVTLGLWLGCAGALLVGMWQRSILTGRLTLALVAAVVVLGSFDHLLGRTSYNLALWLGLGLILALGDGQQEERPL